MTPIVEDGSGLANAECYASVDEASAYFEARGKADACGEVDDQEAALRLATDYLTQIYHGQWAGQRATTTQALDWPRAGVPFHDSPNGLYPQDKIPVEIKRASYELAIRTVDGDLLTDTTRATLSETVDVISVTYASGQSQQTQFTMVHAIVRPLLFGGGGMISVERG